MPRGLFINYFEVAGLDPADSRARNYEILKEKYSEWAGKPSQQARLQADILNQAMETFADQTKYERFLEDYRETRREQQERAAQDRVQRERAERERAERERAEREQAERRRAERDQAEQRRAEPERVERQRPDQERPVPEPARSPRRRRRVVLISAAAAVVAVGGTVGGLVLFSKPAPPPNIAEYVAVSLNGEFLASVASDFSTNDQKIHIWDMATRRIVATLTESSNHIRGIAISPDSKTIAVAHDFSGTDIWSVATRHLVATLNDPVSTGAECLAFSPDGQMLAVCDGEGYGKVYLWDVASKHLAATLHVGPGGPTSSPAAVAFSPDGRTLAVSNIVEYNGPKLPGLEFWNLNSPGRAAVNLAAGENINLVAYSHDGRRLVTGWESGYAIRDLTVKPPREITVTDPTPAANIVAFTSGFGNAVFSPDGKILATSDGNNYSAFLWDATTGHRIGTLTDPDSKGVGYVAYAPDGKTMITSDGNGSLYLWNTGTGHVYATLTNPAS